MRAIYPDSCQKLNDVQKPCLDPGAIDNDDCFMSRLYLYEKLIKMARPTICKSTCTCSMELSQNSAFVTCYLKRLVNLSASKQRMLFINYFPAVSARFLDFVHELPDAEASVAGSCKHARHLRTDHSKVHVPVTLWVKTKRLEVWYAGSAG